MCLAIPGKIESITGEEITRNGRVNFSGITKEINLMLVPEAVVGDYVIVHAGVALSIINEQAAQETFDLIGQTVSMPETSQGERQ